MFFKYVTLQTEDGALRETWNKLNYWIQSRIEAFLGISVVGAGSAPYLLHRMNATNPRELALAVNDSAAHADYVGVNGRALAHDELGVIYDDNVRRVQFVANLNPVPTAGQWAYVSATAGRATNVAPVNPLFVQRVGIVFDGSSYATDGTALVLLNYCCSANSRQEG